MRSNATGTARSITVYIAARSRAKTLVVGLYSGTKRRPGKRIASGLLRSPKGGKWHTVTIPRTRVRSKSFYWIGVLGRRGALVLRGPGRRRCQSKSSSYAGRRHSLPAHWKSRQRSTACAISAYVGGTLPRPLPTSPPASPGPPGSPVPANLYSLPADRQYDWNPGLNPVGGIPSRTSIFRTLSPSGGDDTATIQAALDSCPTNAVVQLTAGVFHISGGGLTLDTSNCTLRGVGPGPGTLPGGIPPAAGTTSGTYLLDPSGSSTVAAIGPSSGGSGTPTNLTADAAKGSRTATVASTSGLAAGEVVILNELTDTGISHWNSQNPENDSGWFEEPDRPLGETMQIASVSGKTVTFTTDLPITYKVAQTAHLYPLTDVVKNSGIEDLYVFGGGSNGLQIWDCAYCWVKHVEGTWDNGAAVEVGQSVGSVIRDSYFHDSQSGLHSGGSSYGIALDWYASDTLVENNIVMRFDKVDVMRSAGGGNVFGYNYIDDGQDLGGQWSEDELEASHMTTPHYALFEGNEAPNADTADTWGNAVYITYFRNDLTGENRDYPGVLPIRAAGLTQYDWWFSFVGNVLGKPGDLNIKKYEDIANQDWTGDEWLICYQKDDNVPDGGKCLSTVLRDGNYDYVTKEVHWYGVGGSGTNNGLTPPPVSTLPDSLYLSGKPAFFGSNPWPWVNGSSAASPVPGRLPALARFDAGTPNAVQ